VAPNIATTENRGFRVEGTWRGDAGLWRAGVDGFTEAHDSNVDNPDNPMFFVVNFNDAERDVYGAYLEHERELAGAWQLDLGARVNRVRSSDAGPVDATPARMNAGGRRAARRLQRRGSRGAPIPTSTWSRKPQLPPRRQRRACTLALAQKQRAPSYQERYLWLPLEATAGLADGQLYLGNIRARSGAGAAAGCGLDLVTERFAAAPAPVLLPHRRLHPGHAAGCPTRRHSFVRMMNAANGNRRADPLRCSTTSRRASTASTWTGPCA
jgi:iron complex outermembrane receptor protein